MKISQVVLFPVPGTKILSSEIKFVGSLNSFRLKTARMGLSKNVVK